MKKCFAVFVALLTGCNYTEGPVDPSPLPDGGTKESQTTCDVFVQACVGSRVCEIPTDCCDAAMLFGCGADWTCEQCCTEAGFFGPPVCVHR